MLVFKWDQWNENIVTFLGSSVELQRTGHRLICISFSRGRHNMDKWVFISRWPEQGVYSFCFLFSPPFPHFLHILLCYLLNHTWEIFLHAGSNPASTLLAFFSKQEWRHLDICWNFRWFLLPSVMDPSSYHLLGFFFTKQTNTKKTIHFFFGHTSPVEWHGFYSHLSFPL